MASFSKWLMLVAMLASTPVVLAVETWTDAPNFALKALDGENHRLSEYRGNVVVLNFWASWCGPCRGQLSSLQQFHDRYHEAGLTILGINIDEHDHDAQDLAAGLGFPVLRDTTHSVSELYDLGRLPLTVLVDRDGSVRHVFGGRDARDANVYLAHLRELLRE